MSVSTSVNIDIVGSYPVKPITQTAREPIITRIESATPALGVPLSTLR